MFDEYGGYITNLLASRFGRRIQVVVDKVALGNHRFEIYFVDGLSRSLAATVVVDATGNAVAEATVNTSLVQPNELKRIVEALGSTALGTAYAILEALPNNVACVKHDDCLKAVTKVEDATRKVLESGVLLVPDEDVYWKVKELLESGGLPFESTVKVEEGDYREVVDYAQRLSYLVRNNPHLYYNRVAECLLGLRYDGLDEGLYPSLELFPDIRRIVIRLGICYINMGLYIKEGYSMTVRVWYDIQSVSRDPAEGIKDTIYITQHLIKNWHSHAIRTLDAAIKCLKSKTKIPPTATEVVLGYLQAWRNLLIKYGNEIEENKKLHL
ncbi:MAG: hypothetical protein QXD83_07650 [Sulfolobales archaeon]